ncbi:MAG: DUF302 domain-containing protein [Haloarculaceae archaeon]
MTYHIDRTVAGSFDDVVERVEAELSEEGFGVLTDIDVDATLRKKLGVEDFGEYRILGACNPSLAHEAMEAERPLGVLLPCNVVVYEDGESVIVSAVDPEAMLSVVDNEAVDDVAAEVREHMVRVLDSLPEKVEPAAD